MAFDAGHHADEVRGLLAAVAATPPQQPRAASFAGTDGVVRTLTIHSHWFEVSSDRKTGEGDEAVTEVREDGKFFYGTDGRVYRIPEGKEPKYAEPKATKKSTARK